MEHYKKIIYDSTKQDNNKQQQYLMSQNINHGASIAINPFSFWRVVVVVFVYMLFFMYSCSDDPTVIHSGGLSIQPFINILYNILTSRNTKKDVPFVSYKESLHIQFYFKCYSWRLTNYIVLCKFMLNLSTSFNIDA